MNVQLVVNGQPRQVEVEDRMLLADLLRDGLGLSGTHIGCDTSQCGCCTVHVDGVAVKSCTMLAAQADGCSIVTIEGLAPAATEAATRAQQDPTGAAPDPALLHPVQAAFAACHGLQCGFCTPGMVMATCALLARDPNPSDAQIIEGLAGNLCRCTGYVNIVAAVKAAASAMHGAHAAEETR